jgi:iron(III) transport system substrate-binding protein
LLREKPNEDAPMKNAKVSRRGVLAGTGALLAGAAFSTRVVAAAPPPEP